jgi:glutamate transport system permease protein
MTSVVLADELGPRGRRQVRIATALGAVAVGALALVVINRFESRGQFDADLWSRFARWSTWRFLFGGLANTVKAAGTAMLLALVVGMLFALGRLARNPVVRSGAGVYVEVFRSYPLVLLVFFAPKLFDQVGFEVEAYWSLVVALAIYNSAILAEIFRAGILSLDRGQPEAAAALGLTYWQQMGFVIVPQAVRRMTPAIVSQLVTLLKDTALGAFIFYEELLRRGRTIGQGRFPDFPPNPLQALLVVAALYVVVNFALSRVARRLEVRQRRRYRAGAIAIAGVEDLSGADSVAAKP